MRAIFGDEVLNPADQTINREKLGEIVFADASKRRALNKSLHGLIALEIVKQILWNLVHGHRFVILDVPLLFESKKFLGLLSYKVVVHCGEDESEQMRRLLKRNPELSETDARQRLDAQMKTREKLKMADFCVDNSRSIEHTRKQVEKIYRVFDNSRKYVWIRAALAALLVGFAYTVFKILF